MNRHGLSKRVSSGVLAVALTLSSAALVASRDAGADDSTAQAGGVTLKAQLKIYSGFEGTLLNDGLGNAANPGNQVLSLPQSTWLEDLRPVFKMETESGLSAVVKPRLQLTGNWVATEPLTGGAAPTLYNQSFDFEWMEAYGRWQIGDSMTVTVGTQNVQWGPGELYSPSNEIVPFFLANNTPLFYLRGHQLFNASWTPSNSSSVQLLAEYAPNQDPTFQSGVPFARKAMLRGETSFTTGQSGNTHTVAMVVGTDETTSTWLGQYANYTASDALSFYADASENFKLTGYYPNQIAAPGSILMTGPEGSNTGIFPRVLVGGRYTFPKGWELRLEYLYNGLGWTGSQYQTAIASLSDPTYGRQNLAAFLAPGLNFLGQHYAYLSFRLGDLGHKDKATYFLRYLQNLTDESGSAIASVEWTPADRWALLGAVIAELGPNGAELTQFQSGEVQTALRVDF